MKPWLSILALACLGTPFAARGLQTPVEAGAADAEFLDDVDRLDADALQRAALLAHGEVGPLLKRLESIEEDESQSTGRRRNARWLRAEILKRRGDLRQALVIFEELADEENSVEAHLERAWLLDARGRTEEALDVYDFIVPRITDEALESKVRVRTAMLRVSLGAQKQGGTAMQQRPDLLDALTDFASAEGRDLDLRNRAAVVLGLLGRPADAIALYVIDEDDPKRFQSEARVADWAIRAGDAAAAQEHAWQAVQSAKLQRDRHYALAVLVETHRLDDTVDALIDKLAAQPSLDPIAQNLWIDLLRERERYDEAIAKFEGAAAGEFTIEMRRELLEMYRESGHADVMLDVYRDLITEEPLEVEWRAGLARVFLEDGNRAEAEAVWRSFLDAAASRPRLLEGARALSDLGLDELAQEAAETCIAIDTSRYAALLFLFDLHRTRGRLDEAAAALTRMDETAPPDAAERYQLADALERLDRQRDAVRVLEGVRAARGAEAAGEDLEMRLAWLYSEIGEEEVALERWLALWRRIQSVARRRYAEDRLMTVAARLGTLADIAIELEEKLVQGTADERESGLLVRLYTKVNDPVSAAEIIDEFMKQSGSSQIDALEEKARVYLTCNDFFNYEVTVRELIEVHPEGEGDYLRQLAMSQLERGKPDEAREVLTHLREIEMGTESAEFEAGVLALAGLREDAIRAYAKGIAENPARIESYLLMANLLRETGQAERAVGMFQHLAETAEKDDLFTIAIDGLLNLEAPASVMQWARRITLERLAYRHDKMYLYQLLTDLAEAVEDHEGMLTALENSLAISGERRPSVLRELMDLARGGRDPFGGRSGEPDTARHLAFGRRLIGLAEVVPPQVYLDLGEAFLAGDEPANAAKTFRMARDLPDYVSIQRRAAGLFETAGYRPEALAMYKQAMVAQSNDVGLMIKVGELEEQSGRDDAAAELYGRALELLFTRKPLTTIKAEERDRTDPWISWYRARNVDDFDQFYGRLVKNLLVVLPDEEAAAHLLATQRAWIADDFARLASEHEAGPDDGSTTETTDHSDTIAHHPRLDARATFHRRLAIAYGRIEEANALDLELLAAFPDDELLLEILCQERARWGLFGSIRNLIDGCGRPEEQKGLLRFLVGSGLDERSARRLPLDQASRLFLPHLIAGRNAEAAVILRRTDFAAIPEEELGHLDPLFAASLYLEDPDLTLQIAREWLRLHVKHHSSPYEVEETLDRCATTLAPPHYRELCRSFTDQILDNPEQNSNLLTVLPELQKRFAEPLISEEEVLALLENYADGGWGFGLGPVVTLLPEAQRGGAMRTVWSKIKPTSRAMFLFNLVGQATEELGDAMSEFVRGVFKQALEETDQELAHYSRQIADSGHNRQLGLDILEIMIERTPEDWGARAGRAVKLLELGREAEALEESVAVYSALFDDDGSDWPRRQAKDTVLRKFAPLHMPLFLAALDDIVAERGDSAELALKRLELMRHAEEPDGLVEFLTLATERYPQNTELLESLYREHRSAGRQREAIGVLERLVEVDESRRAQLVGGWSSLQHPIKALAIKELLLAAETGTGAQQTIPGMPPSFVLAPGSMIRLANGTIITGGTGRHGIEDNPSIDKVKKALDEGDESTARTTFRRLWRRFQKGEPDARNTMYYGYAYGGMQGLAWPTIPGSARSAMPPDATEPKLYRGGLDDWSDEEPTPGPPRPSAFKVLAEHEFGVEEMRRLLNSLDARELDSMGSLLTGLLHARVLRDGEEATRDSLVTAITEGRGGKQESNMLLALLDEYPDAHSATTDTVLGDLVRSVRPTDVEPMRALARVQARLGNTVEARRLYTWCATRTDSSGYSRDDDAPTISATELIKEVREHLSKEELTGVIESILALAVHGNDPWERQNYERLVLETWTDLLPPPAAAAKCRAVLDEATDFRDGLRRDTAKLAAGLLARNGEIDRAIECLEYGICRLSDDVVEGERRAWSRASFPGYWYHHELRRLFPKDHADFVDARAWFLVAAHALEAWRAEARAPERTTPEALVLISLRLSGLEEEDEARRILVALAEDETLTAAQLLWVADAAREVGTGELADAIERRLFDEDRLHLARLADVVEREYMAHGAEAALALGQRATAYTLHPALLETMAAIAGLVGDEGVLWHWNELASEAGTARLKLADIFRAERRAAEADG